MNLRDKQRIFYFPTCENIQVQLVKKKTIFSSSLSNAWSLSLLLRIIFAKIAAVTCGVER